MNRPRILLTPRELMMPWGEFIEHILGGPVSALCLTPRELMMTYREFIEHILGISTSTLDGAGHSVGFRRLAQLVESSVDAEDTEKEGKDATDHGTTR